MHLIRRKSVTKLVLVTVIAVGLSVISGSVYACIDYIGTSDGVTYWIHCGTSAGNFGTACDSSGACVDVTTGDSIAQAQVNMYCEGWYSCLHRDDPIPPYAAKLRIGRPLDIASGQKWSFKRLSVPVQTASLCREK